MASQAGDIGNEAEGKDALPTTSGAKGPAEELEDFPDPDEDDLDDLDDFLPEFSAGKGQAHVKKPEQLVPSPSTAPTPETTVASNLAAEDALINDEMAKELEKGVASFFSDLENSPEMKAQFEDIFKTIAEAATEEAEMPLESSQPSGSSSKAPADPADPAADFQDTIRKTMERMKSSGERTTEELHKEGSKDFMEDLIGMLGKTNLDGEGGQDEFNKMLMGMMEQLTNKEILYEPMKELHDQFPGWLEKNKDKVSKEDLTRYEEQRVIVAEIVTKFEDKTYLDDNAADREYIVDRMQKMQAAGSPPPDLVGDLQSAQDVLNQDMPSAEGCNPQ